MPDNRTFKVGEEVYDIAHSDVNDFLKQNPKAIEAKSFVSDGDTFDIALSDVSDFLKQKPNAMPLGEKKSSVQTASKPVTTGGKAGSFVSQSDEEGSPYALGKDVVPVEKGPVVSKEKEPREALASEFNKFMAESLKPKVLPSDKPAFVKNETELTKIDTELKERKQQADKLNAFIQLNSDRFSDPEKREEYKSQLKERGYTDKEIDNAINIINSKVADKLNAFTQLNSDRFSDPEKKEEYKKELKRIGYTDNEIGNAINIINSEVDEKALAEAKKIEFEQIAKGSPYAPLDMAKKELTPAEVHNQIVEKNIALGTSEFSDNQKELFKLNNEISALYKKPTRTPSDLMKIGELEKKRKQVDSEFKPLVNPLTDEPAGTVEEQQQAVSFAQDVNTKAAGFKETYKGKLADVYHDLADKYKYWSNKYTKDVFMKAESIDPRIQNFPETIEAKRIQENYLGSKSDFFAIAQAYLLNKDVDIEKGLSHGAKVFTENLISQFVPEVLTNSKLLGNMPLDLSGRAYTDAFTKVMHDRQIPLTKEQKEAGKKTFGETVLGELGSLGGFILKLGVYKNLFGIVQEVSGLTRVIQALKNGDRFTKLGAGVLEMAVEEATMQSTGAGAGLGSGFWLSGKAMEKAGLKFKGKIGAIIQPFFDSIVRGSVGGTVGMESGAALSTTVDALMNDKDWKEELRKMYGDLSETGNRILSELVVNSIFGMVHVGKGAFTVDPKKLLKLSEELRSKGRIDAANSIQKKAEEIGRYKPMDTEEIDKFIADNELTKQGKEGGKFPSLPKEPLFPEEAAPTMEWEGDQVIPKTTEDAVQKPSTKKEVPPTGETGQNIPPSGEGVGQAVKGTETAEASKEKVDNNAKAVIDNITVEDHIASNPDLTDFGKENARKNPEEAIAKAKQNAQLAFDYLNGKISPAEYLIEKGFVKNYVEKESAEKLKNNADEESKFWADKINEQAEKTATKAEAPKAGGGGAGFEAVELAASPELIKKAESFGFTKEQVDQMTKEERDEVRTSFDKNDVKDLLAKYTPETTEAGGVVGGEVESKKKSFTEAGEQSKKDQSPKALGNFIIDNAKVGDRIKINENEYYEVVSRKVSKRNGSTEVELQHFVKNEETGNFENNPSAVKLFTDKYRGTNQEKLGYRDASDLFESSYTNYNGEKVIEQSTYEPKSAEQPLKETPKTEAPKTESVEALKNVESTAKALEKADANAVLEIKYPRKATPKQKKVAIEHAGYEGPRRVTSANDNSIVIDGYGTTSTTAFLSRLIENGRLDKNKFKNKNIALSEEYATKLLRDNEDLFPQNLTETKSISEAYHADKAAGKQTELTKAVEDLLGKKAEPSEKTPTAKTEAKFTVEGEDYTPKPETSDVAKKAVKMYYDIKDAEGTTKARKAAKERREFLKENPSFKEIDDNISDIYKQLEQKGLLEKRGDCP